MQVIERLLDWGRMEAGRKLFELRAETRGEPRRPRGRGVRPGARPAPRARLRGRTSIPTCRPFRPTCGAMVDAIGNLLTNALKYGGTPPVVRLRVCRVRQGVAIEVSDNGDGHPAGRAPPHLREVLPDRRPPLARARGQRPGARDRQAHRARAPGPGAGRERARPGDRRSASSCPSLAPGAHGEGRRADGGREGIADGHGRADGAEAARARRRGRLEHRARAAHQPRERGLRGALRGGRRERPDDGARERAGPRDPRRDAAEAERLPGPADGAPRGADDAHHRPERANGRDGEGDRARARRRGLRRQAVQPRRAPRARARRAATGAAADRERAAHGVRVRRRPGRRRRADRDARAARWSR